MCHQFSGHLKHLNMLDLIRALWRVALYGASPTDNNGSCLSCPIIMSEIVANKIEHQDDCMTKKTTI